MFMKSRQLSKDPLQELLNLADLSGAFAFADWPDCYLGR